MNFKLFSLIFCYIVHLIPVESARILGLFLVPSQSHLIVQTSLIKGLAEKGHDVTIVTTLPAKNLNPKIRLIVLESPKSFREFIQENRLLQGKSWLAQLNQIFLIYSFTKGILEHTSASLHDPKMKKLMAEESFDLVISGYFPSDFQLGIAAHFKCPVIMSCTVKSYAQVNSFVGNPEEISYVPMLLSELRQPMGFLGRIKNFLLYVMDWILFTQFDYVMDKYYKEHFPPDHYPTLSEMRRNISLVFVNHHFTQTPISPLVPAIIEIGGIQIKEKPDPLPEDLQQALNRASHQGVIYFSLGSIAKISDLPKDKISVIFSVLSKLNQTVICKWDENDPPITAPNMIFKNWLPQDDILAHNNVKLFISHGGKGSILESEYHGVPIVGIPLFADQSSNLRDVQHAGRGIALDYMSITEEVFRNAIQEVLYNSKYKENAKRFSKLFKDRPMSSQATALFWIEYVLRHHGAPHLQSPAVHMNFFQKQSLDIIAFIAIIIFILIKIFYLFIKCVKCVSHKVFHGKHVQRIKSE